MATIDECIEFALKNIGSKSKKKAVGRQHSSQFRLIPYLHQTSSVLITIAPIGTTQHDFALDHHFAMLTFIFEPTNVISRY
jgi:hypothetical protein